VFNPLYSLPTGGRSVPSVEGGPNNRVITIQILRHFKMAYMTGLKNHAELVTSFIPIIIGIFPMFHFLRPF